MIHEKEWQYWNDAASRSGDDVLGDSVKPVIDAGLAEFVDENHQLALGVKLILTLGHTPGHVSVLIESEGETALITGDCIHHPIQMSRVHWSNSADTNRDQGHKTRRKLLEQFVGSNSLVIGTHFATPTAGYVKNLNDEDYWFDVDVSSEVGAL